MTPVHKGRLTLTSLRNEIVGEGLSYLYSAKLQPVWLASSCAQAFHFSELVKRKIWLQVPDQIFDPLEAVITAIDLRLQENDRN